METFLIAGLGNPGAKYENTRHNAGFRALDALAGMCGAGEWSSRFRGLFASAVKDGRKLLFLKPQTFMNLSGESVRAAADYYRIEPDHIIVLCDDVSFPCGRMRVRTRGSAGGHNGLRSIIECLGSPDFIRVRMGVGEKKPEMDLADHVLSRFPPDESVIMQEVYTAAAQSVIMIIESGAEKAMSHYNGFNPAPEAGESQGNNVPEKP